MGGEPESDPDPEFEARRDRLVRSLRERGYVRRDATARALRAVPRHEFVPEPKRPDAYEDRPLPIGEGQTISAPHMVATMCDRLELDPGDRVLEIGTGCGYHAAVTAELVGPGTVFSVEYDASLAAPARERLARLGYDIAVRVGDGHDGWPDHAPYDAAYLTCAPRAFPPRVLEQLRPGGRILGPLGGGRQTLVEGRKRDDGRLERRDHGGVRFVPMRGG